MTNKKRICVVTSTRAEYGLLFWLMKSIERSNNLELNLVATGTHLSAEYGNTFKLIEKDGFKIDHKIPILSSEHGNTGVVKSAANAVEKFGKYFAEVKPSAVILLGDRYEILAVAQAGVICNIPIVHLHGGEITEGANDDMFRHAITKLSCFHFTSSTQHRNRVIQMGEKPATVKLSGALGIENIKKLSLLNKEELENKYKIRFQKKIFLVAFHPATLEKESPEKQFEKLLKAIAAFKETTFIISKANADAGGDRINAMIDEFIKQNKNSLTSHSFGQLNYLSLLKISNVMIGNSSSGIIEAPSLLTPTVNIGSRQKGRLSANSVIHCSPETKEIIRAITLALKLKGKGFHKNPYDYGNSSDKIVNILEKLKFDELLPKKFHTIF